VVEEYREMVVKAIISMLNPETGKVLVPSLPWKSLFVSDEVFTGIAHEYRLMTTLIFRGVNGY
jgi:hypothetical protein